MAPGQYQMSFTMPSAAPSGQPCAPGLRSDRNCRDDFMPPEPCPSLAQPCRPSSTGVISSRPPRDPVHYVLKVLARRGQMSPALDDGMTDGALPASRPLPVRK
jgi:hypothetical protein